jgi:hypothetical protein
MGATDPAKAEPGTIRRTWPPASSTTPSTAPILRSRRRTRSLLLQRHGTGPVGGGGPAARPDGMACAVAGEHEAATPRPA